MGPMIILVQPYSVTASIGVLLTIKDTHYKLLMVVGVMLLGDHCAPARWSKYYLVLCKWIYHYLFIPMSMSTQSPTKVRYFVRVWVNYMGRDTASHQMRSDLAHDGGYMGTISLQSVTISANASLNRVQMI